jgi:hypothetical protein
MLQRCYIDITLMLYVFVGWLFVILPLLASSLCTSLDRNVTKMLRRCFKDVTKMLQRCYKDVTWLPVILHPIASSLCDPFGRCYKDVRKMSQIYNKYVTNMLQTCCKCVAKMLQRRYTYVTCNSASTRIITVHFSWSRCNCNF